MLTRKVIGGLAALGAVLWLVQAVQVTLREQRRRELSRQLVPALDEGEWRKVALLVRQGADPLTRGTDGSTSLASVLTLGDVAATRKILSEHRDDLLLVSREVSALPSQGFEPLYRLEDCIGTLERVVAVPDAPANAWIGLAELRRRLGKYEAAEAAYRTALRIAPDCAAAREGQAAAAAAAEAAHRIEAALTGRSLVSQVAPAAAADPSLWFALSTPYDRSERPWWELLRATLALYRVDGRGCRRIGRAMEVHDPRTIRPPERAAMFGQDITGDGVPDVAVETTTSALGCSPSYLEVFTAGAVGPRRLLSVTSSEQLWLEDLNGDRKVEIRNQYEIGTTMSHVEQIRWTDVYTYEGGRYVLSNRRFPNAFARFTKQLPELLEAYPGDWELLDYLGRLHEIRGQQAQAISCYLQAATALALEINRNGRQYAGYLRERQRRIFKQLRDMQVAPTAEGQG